jgi:hypothetical protein
MISLIDMKTSSIALSVVLLVIVGGREGRSETGPTRVTKCQLPDGHLYFGPTPPADCETIAVYENGKQVDRSGAEPSPTVGYEPQPGGEHPRR